MQLLCSVFRLEFFPLHFEQKKHSGKNKTLTRLLQANFDEIADKFLLPFKLKIHLIFN